jgi:CheY-like chemotaxis protein
LHNQVTAHTDERRPVASILVIDDEEAVRGLFRAILEPLGYTIVEARDGLDGLSRYREAPTDLVITDMSMPRGDGLEVIRTLRADFPTLKILAVSGAERPDESTEALRMGATAMLSKPVGVNELRTAVAHCLLDRAG